MPVSELDNRAAQIAIAEWWAWGGQYVDGELSSLEKKKVSNGPGVIGLENKSGYKQKVFSYFKSGVFPNSNGWRNYKTEPWSAAFISYCMRLAGTGKNFPYSVGHHRYVSEAVKNSEIGNRQNSLVAYNSSDIAPNIGDLLWRGRKPNQGLDTSKWKLQDIKDHINAGRGGFPSHCDLVIWVDHENDHIFSVGGNVSNRVLRMKSKVNEFGLLKDSRYNVVIKNNISELLIS